MSARVVFRNFGFLAGGRALGDFFLFLLLVVISRRFGPEGTGHYGVAVSIAGFAAVLADFGLHPYTIKETSRSAFPRRLPGTVALLRGAFGALVFAAIGAGALAVADDRGAAAVAVVVAAQFLLRGVAEGFGAVFVGRDAAHVASTLDVCFRGSGALAAIALVLGGASLPLALLPLPFAEGLHGAAAAWLLRRRIGPLWDGDGPVSARRILREARPYALSRVLAQTSPRIPVPLLGVMLGAGPAGLYHAAYRFIFVLTWIPHFAGMALFPQAVRAHAESERGARSLYQQALGGLVLIGVPATVGCVWVAPHLTALVFGESFHEAASVLRWLAPLVFLACLHKLMAVFLMACNRIGARTASETKAALVNLAANLALIPALGAVGAAIAIVISETLLVALFARALAPVVGWPRLGTRLAAAGAGALLFSAALALLPPLPLLATVALAALLYAALLLAFPQIRRVELRLLSGCARRGPRSRDAWPVTQRKGGSSSQAAKRSGGAGSPKR